ncbi:MAG: hypothetical protein ABI672_17785, partial [Vicinamibacteria bacterium]
MLTINLLLGADGSQHVDIDVAFWLRAVAGAFAFVVFVALRDWSLKRLQQQPTPRRKTRRIPFITAVALGLASSLAYAGDAPPDQASSDQAAAAPANEVKADPPPAITVGAYVETYFGWNFNKPENGITAFRGFDAR